MWAFTQNSIKHTVTTAIEPFILSKRGLFSLLCLKGPIWKEKCVKGPDDYIPHVWPVELESDMFSHNACLINVFVFILLCCSFRNWKLGC